MNIKLSYFDVDTRVLYCGEECIVFTPKEFMMVYFLIKARKVVCIDELVANTWGEKGKAIEKNNIFQLSHRIRKKLYCIDECITFYISTKNGCYCGFNKPVIFVKKNKAIMLAVLLLQKLRKKG